MWGATGVEVRAKRHTLRCPRRGTPLTIVFDVILPIFGLLTSGYGATFTRGALIGRSRQVAPAGDPISASAARRQHPLAATQPFSS
jgi:hypothetical protein